MHEFLDFLITGDFRYPGGTSSAIAEEIKVLRDSPFSWKLVQFDSKVFVNRDINAKIATITNADDYVGEGTKIRCRTWFVHNPHCLQWGIPDLPVEADRVVIVAHQAPTSLHGKFYYDPWAIDGEFRQKLPDAEVCWAPISPLCRQIFDEIGFDRQVLEFDWYNVFSGPYLEPATPSPNGLIRIGCHGRPQPEKWPATRAEALSVYPDEDGFEVTLLGISSTGPSSMVPPASNWKTYPFGSLEVNSFLSMIDFFVYRPRPEWTETFGRTVAEAILHGRLAILPHSLRPTFGDLALYADAEEVKELLQEYSSHPAQFRCFVERASSKARHLFGPEGLSQRFQKLSSTTNISSQSRTRHHISQRRRARSEYLRNLVKNEIKCVVKRSIAALSFNRIVY